MEIFQIGFAAPANGMMFFQRTFGFSGIFRARPIHHADVFVRFVDAMDVEETRRNQRARAGFGGGRAFADQFDVEATFFFGFAQRGDFGIFIEFDVSAEWQPFAEFAMVDQKDFAFVNDEDCDGEINFFVDVRHAPAAWPRGLETSTFRLAYTFFEQVLKCAQIFALVMIRERRQSPAPRENSLE